MEPPYLYRVEGQLTEAVLLSIIHSTRSLPGAKIRTITVSPGGAAEFVRGLLREYRPHTDGLDEDSITLKTPAFEGVPGVRAMIEVSFALPGGYVSID
jgi:hypothetical protein